MSDENKEILEQVTELISSKKEKVKNTDTNKVMNQSEKKIDDIKNNNLKTESSTDSYIRSELRRWISKNAEEIAKDIIKENTKKIFKKLKFKTFNMFPKSFNTSRSPCFSSFWPFSSWITNMVIISNIYNSWFFNYYSVKTQVFVFYSNI